MAIGAGYCVLDALAMRLAAPPELFVDACRVPVEAMVAQPGHQLVDRDHAERANLDLLVVRGHHDIEPDFA